jgi:hypothetical protein
MANLDAAGQESRGAAQPITMTVQRSGDVALVRTCANTSTSGLYDKKSGRLLKSGVARDNFLMTLKRDRTGAWKVSALEHKQEQC